MTKHTILGVLGLFALCLSLVAQYARASDRTISETISNEELRETGEIDTADALTLNRPDLFASVDGSILIHGLPVMTLLDGRRFPISSSLGRMGTTAVDIFPVAFLSAVEVRKPGHAPISAGSDSPMGAVDLRLNRDYTSGEVGVFYGKSGGKYGREDFQTYVVGGAGNDRFHITAGAAYQESTVRVPRR